MKKFLLVIALILSAVAGADASTPAARLLTPRGETHTAGVATVSQIDYTPARKAPAKAGEVPSMDFALCGDPYAAWSLKGVNAGDLMSEAFELTPENSTLYAGNQITAINVMSGVNQLTEKNQIKDVTVFIKESLEGEPVYSQAGVLGSDPFTWYPIRITTPFTIEAGKDYFIGFSYKVESAKDLYVVADYMNHGDDDAGGYVTIPQNGKMVWNNVSAEVGFLCIGATLSGNSLPTDRVVIGNSYVPEYTAPGAEFYSQLLIENRASNAVTSVGVSAKVGNGAVVEKTLTLESPIAFGQLAVVTIDGLKCTDLGTSVPVEITVTKVNGNANKAEAKLDATIACFNRADGFTRRCVMEEGTGTWCGWCPGGIVLIEDMKKLHNDGSFIAIGVHSGDDMAISGYRGMISTYFTGFPSYIMNRYPSKLSGLMTDADNNLTTAEDLYRSVITVPAMADIEISCSPATANNRTEVTAKTRYAFDVENATYALVFVAVQDGVGPFNQTNNYAGQQANMGDWTSYAASQSWIYDDVARSTSRWNGVLNSVPTTLKKGQVYEFTYQLDIAPVTSDNYRVVGMVVDTANGTIVNAVEVEASKQTGGVDDITVTPDADAPVEYFNLQGVRVNPDNAAAGLYIRRQGGKATKVLVK